MLTTFWIPMVNLSLLKHQLKNKTNFKESFSNQIDTISLNRDEYNIIIDSLGFYYIQSKDKNENKFNNLLKDIITKRSQDILQNTFLNKKLACNIENYSIIDFINNIKVEIEQIDDINLEYINYNIENSQIQEFKFTNKNNPNNIIERIIERNFKGLLKKSILYTHEFTFEKNEVYNLEILNKIDYTPFTSKINLTINNLQDINKDVIITTVIKKAIQDTIEEATLLRFLEQTKKRYIVNIYDKIDITNSMVNKIQSQILAIDTIEKDNRDTNCSIDNEEDIENFIEYILQALPKFRVIDDKIKNAYYIKIGNITTSNSINKNETIENTLFYQKWLSSINYFESMAYQLKEVISIYHQNKNIKELENISYYENYKSDLEDIKSIQFNENEKYGLSNQQKSTIERYVLAVAVFALAGEAPIINPQHIYNFLKINTNTGMTIIDLIQTSTIALETTIFNVLLYSIIFILIFQTFRVESKKLYNTFTNLFKRRVDKKKEYFFHFDPSDYDKHEHRSTKLLTTYKNNKATYLTVDYDERNSAYNLMQNLKDIKINKKINECFEYPLFPNILTEAVTKNSNIRENYRISRTDKVTTKILLRYKITEITLFDFLNFILKDKDFIKYYNNIKEKENFVENIVNDIEQDCIQEYKNSLNYNEFFENKNEANNGIYLNLYIVYSFNLKLNSHKSSKYLYQVQKDQFRVHYHINKLPQNNIEELLKDIAELIYIYFLARLKNFDYIYQE